ncbi:MAG: hypothetical protein S0880_35575 [Actinomycetota bacterium]|nr:hypothetical protein [Actinomycetota bacterium]
MSTPHLTPASFLSGTELPPEWAAADVALICFTPLPAAFDEYVVGISADRYFLHSPPSEVRLCRFGETAFVVISEVYGFAVGATTVEELVHHGFRHIIGVGFVGAMNGARHGQRFLARDVMSDLPLAAHYGIGADVRCEPTKDLATLVASCMETDEAGLTEYTVWNGNSLYREYAETLRTMTDKGCDVVNMDTLSVYAVTPVCAEERQREVSCVYVGTVSDEIRDGATAEVLGGAVKKRDNPDHDELVRFIVETVLPQL